MLIMKSPDEFILKKPAKIAGKHLLRDEVTQVWGIDRSETIDAIYYLENDVLVLKPEHYDMSGWPPGEAQIYMPLLIDCFDRGGWFYGLFDPDKMIGVAILENKFIGRQNDLLQLKFMHVSHTYRKRGFGHQLFDLAKSDAARRGARGIYISATPSENTVNFYLKLGSRVTTDPDPELFHLEPDDIHLICKL